MLILIKNSLFKLDNKLFKIKKQLEFDAAWHKMAANVSCTFRREIYVHIIILSEKCISYDYTWQFFFIIFAVCRDDLINRRSKHV